MIVTSNFAECDWNSHKRLLNALESILTHGMFVFGHGYFRFSS
jgi:hypothetical protein